MSFKSVQTHKILFGKNKGKLSVHIELVIDEAEFDEIFDKHYKQLITEKAVQLNGLK